MTIRVLVALLDVPSGSGEWCMLVGWSGGPPLYPLELLTNSAGGEPGGGGGVHMRRVRFSDGGKPFQPVASSSQENVGSGRQAGRQAGRQPWRDAL